MYLGRQDWLHPRVQPWLWSWCSDTCHRGDQGEAEGRSRGQGLIPSSCPQRGRVDRQPTLLGPRGCGKCQFIFSSFASFTVSYLLKEWYGFFSPLNFKGNFPLRFFFFFLSLPLKDYVFLLFWDFQKNVSRCGLFSFIMLGTQRTPLIWQSRPSVLEILSWFFKIWLTSSFHLICSFFLKQPLFGSSDLILYYFLFFTPHFSSPYLSVLLFGYLSTSSSNFLFSATVCSSV